MKTWLLPFVVLGLSMGHAFSQKVKPKAPEKPTKTAEQTEVDQLLNLASTVYLRDGQYRKVDSICNSVYERCIKIRYLPGQAQALSRKGIANKYLGNFQESIKHHFTALALFSQLKDSSSMAKCYSNIGTVEKELGNFPKASEYQLTSLRLAEKIRDEDGVARASQNLGLVFKLQHRYAEAMNYYRITESIYRKLKDTFQLSRIIENKIIIFNATGNLDSALIQNEEVVRLSSSKGLGKNRSNFSLSTIAIHKQLASRAKSAGDSTGAKKHLLSALQVSRETLKSVVKTGDKLSEARTRAALGGSYQMLGMLDSARVELLKSVVLLEQLKNYAYLKGNYKGLSEVDSLMALDKKRSIDDRLYHAQQALNYFTLAEITKSKVLNEENSKKIEELKLTYETEKKDQAIALLNKDNNLKNYALKERQIALQLLRLKNEKSRDEIEILNKTTELQELGLSKAREIVRSKTLETKAKAALLEISEKDKILKDTQLAEEVFIRNTIVGGISVALIMGLLVFNRFRLRRKIEYQQAILDQRKRISADLHDDVGATLSSISIYTEAIKTKLKNNEPERVMELVNKIGENSRETISTLGDIVWNLNPINDSAEKLFNRMESTATLLLSAQNTALDFKTDRVLFDLEFSLEAKQNLYLIFKETINNAAKYARASVVNVSIQKVGNLLEMNVSDNGTGFDTTQKSEGNGLRNIRLRTEALGGAALVSSSGSGTKTEIRLPISSLQKG